jgi:hypothetical protein
MRLDLVQKQVRAEACVPGLMPGGVTNDRYKLVFMLNTNRFFRQSFIGPALDRAEEYWKVVAVREILARAPSAVTMPTI